MPAFKVKPEHVEFIKNAIAPFNNDKIKKSYQDKGLSNKRCRWDMLWAAKLSQWVSDNIYTYANDDHIDSVLRHLTGLK